ncbi:MAG: hypothetical protein ACOC8E_06285 [Planctomycetota bacterium]
MTGEPTMIRYRILLCGLVLGLAASALASEMADDFRIKRDHVFEFTEPPTCTRKGDDVTVRFASRGWCDVTVVIERTNGRIIRHLASGVLGPNAPPPLRPNSLEQTLVWDGKDDTGVYIDDLSGLRVRVSLGLRARFERELHWHPKRRLGMRKMPRVVAQPEGVYVYEGAGCETIRLFNHDGKYIRTVHPFPSTRVADVNGLPWNKFPDGHRAPRARGYWRSTYLMGGEGDTRSKWASTANAFDVRNGRIAMVSDWGLCRLNTDGTAGPAPIYGPKTNTSLEPQSIALSPGGRWLYLTGCYKAVNRHRISTHLARVRWHHGVYRMKYRGNEPAKLWKGSVKKAGKGENLFDHPSWVCVDEKGRVYIADNHNDRVQIYAPDGTLLKTLPVQGPAVLQIHHKTQDLYVFSWTMALAWGYTAPPHKVQAALRVFAPFESDKPTYAVPLPLQGYQGHTRGFQGSPHYDECPYRATLDSYTDPPTIWMGTYWGRHRRNNTDRAYGLSRYRIAQNKLVLLERWNRQVAKALTTWMPTRLMRKRLYVDPRNGTLYVAEAAPKAVDRLTRIDPETGQSQMVTLPFLAEDLTFDMHGRACLRTAGGIVRYEPAGAGDWREVPFDYGERRMVGHTYDRAPQAQVISCIVFPGERNSHRQYFGIATSSKGHIAVGTPYSCKGPGSRDAPDASFAGGTTYRPQVYPGRSGKALISVFDRHGKTVYEDALQGAEVIDGVRIDKDDNVYAQVSGLPLENGKLPPQPNLVGCTLMKAKARKLRMLSKEGIVPLPKARWPDRPPDFLRMNTTPVWAQGVDWMYGGVGISGIATPVNHCHCQATARFDLDYFARSFAIEVPKFQIVVLDTNEPFALCVDFTLCGL